MEVRDLDASHARRRESDGVSPSGWEGDANKSLEKKTTKDTYGYEWCVDQLGVSNH